VRIAGTVCGLRSEHVEVWKRMLIPVDLMTTQAFADERCTESYSIRPRGLHHGDGTYKG